MTTPAQIRNDLRQLREENAQSHKELDDRSHDRHASVMAELKRLNGTQREHSIAIAQMHEIQRQNCQRLEKAEDSQASVWKVVRRLDKGSAVRWGYAAGAAAVVVLVLQGMVLPFVKHLLGH